MGNVWFSSDFHGYHKNICAGSTEWKSFNEGSSHQKTRDFKDQFHMTDNLVNSINKYVKPDDILYYLGDWTFGGIDNIWNLRNRLNVKTIHFIYGNHDHHIEQNRILTNCHRDRPYGTEILDGPGQSAKDIEYPDYVEAQSLFTSCQYYLEESFNKQRFVMCHFAFRVWNKSHHGSINLYGHSHDTLDFNKKELPYGKSMDVGVDSAFRIFGEYRPFHIEEVRKTMEKRLTKVVDHHTKNTN